ncbi:MAG: hypothetical protein NTW01_13425 [Gammaproteobacteria bacterium]|uniref:DUF7931 domain-containing protein n=1 Tax=Nevskia sp. TaxID=1929292 RepID=UPI0040358D6D|nr:hypothetical protein [Gammaproteobacteria bacterium]
MTGAADAPAPLEGRAALASALLAMAVGARHELLLLSVDLDRALYGSEAFVEAIKALALSSARARVRVLVGQPRAAMQAGHRLVELGRRLPSRIEFRELAEERRAGQHADWLIADQRCFIERNRPDALLARLHGEALRPAWARAAAFLALWEESPGCAEFRTLCL